MTNFVFIVLLLIYVSIIGLGIAYVVKRFKKKKPKADLKLVKNEQPKPNSTKPTGTKRSRKKASTRVKKDN